MKNKDEVLGACSPASLVRSIDGIINKVILRELWVSYVVSEVGCTANAFDSLAECTNFSIDEVKNSILYLAKIDQIIFDSETCEILIPQWLQYNYLQTGTRAENMKDILNALNNVKSIQLRTIIIDEIARIDKVKSVLSKY